MAKSTSTSIDDDLDSAVEAMSAAPVTVVGKNSDPSLSGDFLTIKIHATRDEAEKGPVFVSLNGYAYQIPRGVNVSVPVEVVEILDNAVMTTYPTEGGIVTGSVDVPRHGYQTIRAPRAAAAAA